MASQQWEDMVGRRMSKSSNPVSGGMSRPSVALGDSLLRVRWGGIEVNAEANL